MRLGRSMVGGTASSGTAAGAAGEGRATVARAAAVRGEVSAPAWLAVCGGDPTSAVGGGA